MSKIIAINGSPRKNWNTATLLLLSIDTMQVKDCTRYHLGCRDGEAKRRRHETVFPEDRRKA